jgi:hypothetical protein
MMLPLLNRAEGFLRALLRRLPLSDYKKTRLWATSLSRPVGRVKDWPYYRCIELATRSFATPEGYSVAFPGAGDPDSKYSMLEFGVGNGNGFQILLHFRDVWLKRLLLKNKVSAVGFDTFEGIPAARADRITIERTRYVQPGPYQRRIWPPRLAPPFELHA